MRMGTDHDDFRPDHPDLSLDMEVEEAEEVVAPPSDDDDEQPDDENQHEDEEDHDDETPNAQPDELKEQFSGTDDDDENERNGGEDEGTESEHEDEGSTDSGVWEEKSEFNRHSFLHRDVPLVASGPMFAEARPATPAPCAQCDFTAPMFEEFWGESSCALSSPTCGALPPPFDEEAWPLVGHLEPSSPPYFAWPSQVILPQVMVWSHREHVSCTAKNPNEKITSKQRKLQRR